MRRTIRFSQSLYAAMAVGMLAFPATGAIAQTATTAPHSTPAISGAVTGAVENPLRAGSSWADISDAILGDKADAPMLDGSAIFKLDLPPRAMDAALVPIRITAKEGAPRIEKLTIVIDENPAPLAAVVTFSDMLTPLDFETRIRLDLYSNVRVIVEAGGRQYMDGRFVKASGGCSAPATRAAEEALKEMGTIRVRSYDAKAAGQSVPVREAQVMIRHPNYSGLQRDQLTQLFVPAMYIDNVDVAQGDQMLFRVDSGISISENPVFRFVYKDNGAEDLMIKASDTDGRQFAERVSKTGITLAKKN